jgi:hypothetical protein
MTSVPKPLKFLRAHYDPLKEFYAAMQPSPNKVAAVSASLCSWHVSASPRAVGVVGAAARWCGHGCACAGLIVRSASLPFVCVSASCPHAQRMEVHVRMHACACVCALAHKRSSLCAFRAGTVALVILPRKSDAVDSTRLSCVAGEARRHSGDPRDDDVARRQARVP